MTGVRSYEARLHRGEHYVAGFEKEAAVVRWEVQP